jgi:uncharacterized SAM-binding protein YcdF (DUF218 family)
MTLTLLGLLVLFSLAARRVGRRWLAHSVGTITLLLFLAIACGPVPAWLLDNLQEDYATAPFIHWSTRNVIVLLAAGTTRSSSGVSLQPTLFANGRIIEAAALYRQCKLSAQQCILLVSGGDSQHHGSAESTVYARVLATLGVSPQDIQAETLSMNTFENARYSRALVLIYDPQTLVLVTSGIHLRRSLIDFRHFSMTPIPVASDQLEATLGFWPQASNLELCDVALHEYIGIAQYYVYNALGWNSMPVLGPAKPSGAG